MWIDGVLDDGPGKGTARAPPRAAPRVPEDKAKAVEEFRASVERSTSPKKRRITNDWDRR